MELMELAAIIATVAAAIVTVAGLLILVMIWMPPEWVITNDEDE